MINYLRNVPSNYFQGKICLLRLDFNTADDWRMEASLKTLKFLSNKCRAILILGHKGRPNGFDGKLCLGPEARRLSDLLKKPVTFINHFRFNEIKNTLEKSSPQSSIYLLENLRFLKNEGGGGVVLAKNLASLGDFYINEAFAVSHRRDTSVAVLPKFIKSFAGFEMEEEIKNLSKAIKNSKKPLVFILGGGKALEKLKVFSKLKNKVSVFLVGGALDGKTFKKKDGNLIFPIDSVRNKKIMKDIGKKTIAIFKNEIAKAGTIIWNGPLGDIDEPCYSNGTKAIALAIVKNRKAFKIAGGGETVMFLKELGLMKKFDFISTGGGAMLEFLAGKKLPGILALEK